MINLVCLGWFSFCLWSLDEENNRTIMWEGWRGRAEVEEQVVIMMNEMMAHWPSNAAASLPVGVSCPTTTVRPCLIHTHTHTQPFFPLPHSSSLSALLNLSPFPLTCPTICFISRSRRTCPACYDNRQKQGTVGGICKELFKPRDQRQTRGDNEQESTKTERIYDEENQNKAWWGG